MLLQLAERVCEPSRHESEIYVWIFRLSWHNSDNDDPAISLDRRPLFPAGGFANGLQLAADEVWTGGSEYIRV